MLLVTWVAQAKIFVGDRRQQSDGSLPLLRSVGLLHHAKAGVGGPASTAEFVIGADPARPGRFASRNRVDVLRAEARRMPAAPVNRRPGS